MAMNPFASLYIILCALCVEAATIATDAPGWVFRKTEAPVFKVDFSHIEHNELKDGDEDIVTSAFSVADFIVRDWRGREVARGEVAPDNTITLAPLPPGYYRGECGGEPFTFCVVTTNRCREADSFFAADSALSGCSRRGSYDCPWHGGDCWHVTAELLGKCGVVHTRERLEWGPFIEPQKGKRDFSRYLASARAMKENGVVSTGIFHDVPQWLRKPGVSFASDLVELHRFMEAAARTFDPYYDSWEFWNEQDLGSGTSWEYAASLKAFALGARTGSPTTVILPGALAQVEHFGYAQNMFESDIAKYVQALNLHTYVPVANYDEFHADARKFLEEAGVPDWQIWLTESGTTLEGNGLAPSSRKGLMQHDEEQELVMAEFFPKSAILHQQGGVFRNWFFLFGVWNEQGGCRDWGTMRRDGTVKPIHAAISAATSELGDATLLGEKRLGEGLRGFLYAKPNGSRTLAFWSVSNLEKASGPKVRIDSDCQRHFSIAAANGEYRLTDVMGTPSHVHAEDGTLALTATRYPQYLSGLAGIEADVPPADPGRLSQYSEAPDEDLSIIIRPLVNREDFTVSGGANVAELGKEKGRISVEVWNLSPEPKRGRLAVSCGRIEGAEGEIAVEPWSCAVVDALYAPPPDGDLSLALDFSGVFDGRKATRIRIPVFNAWRFLAEGEVIELPSLNSPSAWKRNDSGSKYACTFDEEEKAVRFDVEWSGDTGAWFFPVYECAPDVSFEGARYLEFEVKNRQDKVESDMFCVEVMALYKGRPHKSLRFRPPAMHWETRRVLLPPDAGEMTGFRVGGLISGHKLSYWVRNFRLIKGKAAAPVPKAATPKSCIGMARSWDPYPGWWEKRHSEKLAEIDASGGEIDLVFVGDSITHNWEGARGPGSAYGGRPLAELKKRYSVLNLGFGGDSTRNVLWRLQNGELDGFRAKCFMLLVGTNNWDDPKDTAAGVKAILDLIARKQPQARTILLPIFPSGATADHPWRVHKDKVNARLKNLADGERVVWHDFNARFLNPDGTFRPGLMGNDDLQPLPAAYDIWAEEVTPLFEEIVGK